MLQALPECLSRPEQTRANGTMHCTHSCTQNLGQFAPHKPMGWRSTCRVPLQRWRASREAVCQAVCQAEHLIAMGDRYMRPASSKGSNTTWSCDPCGRRQGGRAGWWRRAAADTPCSRCVVIDLTDPQAMVEPLRNSHRPPHTQSPRAAWTEHREELMAFCEQWQILLKSVNESCLRAAGGTPRVGAT
jgi:hypothetical protein